MERLNCRRFLDGRVTLYLGDCLAVLDQLPENSVDAVITDPPYHFDTIVARFGKDGSAPAKFGSDGVFSRASVGFMGKDWDGGDIAFRPETWAKVLRVLKPGGHLAAFSAPKCVHKMAFGIGAAGFEVRDRILNFFDPDEHVIAFLESLTPAQADALFRLTDHFGGLGEAFWTFGSGFPKSHDVSKAIDKLLGAERQVIGRERISNDIRGGALLDIAHDGDRPAFERDITAPGSPEAQAWEGWGTALKPAYEPIVIARKPLGESSVGRQVLKTGTGAINIDAARVGDEEMAKTASNGMLVSDNESMAGGNYGRVSTGTKEGRFPANLTHDGSDAVLAGFPFSESQARVGKRTGRKDENGWGMAEQADVLMGHSDSGSAGRFFYTAKADAHDRIGSGHPTVKPLDLMQWLCRMLCPPGGTILDLFGGTGTTGEAAFREGFDAILIEREPEYQADIARRMENATAGPVARRHAATKAKAERQAKTGSGAATPAAAPVIDDMFGGGA